MFRQRGHIADLLFMVSEQGVLLLFMVLEHVLGGSCAELGLQGAGVGAAWARVACALAMTCSWLPWCSMTFIYAAWTLATVAVTVLLAHNVDMVADGGEPGLQPVGDCGHGGVGDDEVV